MLGNSNGKKLGRKELCSLLSRARLVVALP